MIAEIAMVSLGFLAGVILTGVPASIYIKRITKMKANIAELENDNVGLHNKLSAIENRQQQRLTRKLQNLRYRSKKPCNKV